MGWYGNYTSQDSILREMLTQDTNIENKWKVKEHSFQNFKNELWLLLENIDTKEKTIKLILITKHDGLFMYKPMDIGCHPFRYSCPKKFIKQLNESLLSEYATNWLTSWKECQETLKAKRKQYNKIHKLRKLYHNM
jgi:arginyl-tRNA synthetase